MKLNSCHSKPLFIIFTLSKMEGAQMCFQALPFLPTFPALPFYLPSSEAGSRRLEGPPLLCATLERDQEVFSGCRVVVPTL